MQPVCNNSRTIRSRSHDGGPPREVPPGEGAHGGRKIVETSHTAMLAFEINRLYQEQELAGEVSHAAGRLADGAWMQV